jgi:hypothetical protein
MTHDERIERMARAFAATYREGHGYHEGIEAALAAAGIEGMVREAANRGFVAGFDWHTDYKTYSSCSEIDAIVREVMGK